jgi:hypothetical protein
MKVSAMMRWVGPAAIAGGVLMVFSDLLNLTIYVPGLGEAAHTGYQAVGSGVILFALTLLLVGMVGLYARSGPADGARVIEYGDAQARYVLAELVETAGSPARTQSFHRNPSELRDVKPRHRRAAHRVGEHG